MRKTLWCWLQIGENLYIFAGAKSLATLLFSCIYLNSSDILIQQPLLNAWHVPDTILSTSHDELFYLILACTLYDMHTCYQSNEKLARDHGRAGFGLTPELCL